MTKNRKNHEEGSMTKFKILRSLFLLLTFVGISTPSRSEGIESLLHFMSFTLGQTTFDEVQKAWGESACGLSPAGKRSLGYWAGEQKVCFSNLFVDSQHFDQYSISIPPNYPESRDKCFSKTKPVELPGGLYMGMSQGDFKKCMKKLIDISPNYHYFPEFQQVTDECSYNFEKWDGSCQCLFVDGDFDEKDKLSILIVWTQVTCQGTPGPVVPGEE
jgi:hypothetical protein